MPKPLRTVLQGVTYHCFSRCQGMNDLLFDRFAKKFFIEAIQMCQSIYEFELNGAEIVGNHFHLVIRTLKDKETISRIMQYIKARTAEKYNKATGRTGPFWNERFGSTIVEESDNWKNYLFTLLWYIGFNPVRKGESKDPRENYIGFVNCYLTENYELPIKITLHPYFYRLGDNFSECVKRFILYEDAYRRRIALYF